MESRKQWIEAFETRLVKFSVDTIQTIESIPQTYAVMHLSKQLIRSATSIALNYGEARAAESTRDFVHKMMICLKETNESILCLRILSQLNTETTEKLGRLIDESNQFRAIFLTSIKRSKAKPRQ